MLKNKRGMFQIALVVLFLIITTLIQCRFSDNQKKPQQDCKGLKTINGLGIYFNDLPFRPPGMIQVRIGSGNSAKSRWEVIKMNTKLVDSLRKQWYFYLDREISIGDTVYLKLANGKLHAVYNFKYLLRPHRSSGSVSYGCDFYELFLDGKKQSGGVVSLER